MSTVLAGHTFTIPEAFEWAGIDAHLKTMDTQGRAANWSDVTAGYTTPFLLDTYNDYALNLGSSGFTIKQLLYYPEGFEYITEDRLPLLHGFYGDTWSFDDSMGMMLCGGNSVCNGPDNGPLDFVETANAGTGFAAGWDDVSRREMLTKGSAYANVLYHVWHRMALGLTACANGYAPAQAHSPGVYEWESAWALFAGSLEGVDGSTKGYSVYALGDKRCPQFSTCVDMTSDGWPTSTSGLAAPNEAARTALEAGIALFEAVAAGSADGRRRACVGAIEHLDAFVAASVVPLVQGTLREAYEVDPAAGGADADGLVEVAEGWAFAAPILPLVSKCNATAGDSVYDNMWLNADPHVRDGFAAVKAAVESVYPCLGISCGDAGGMLSDGEPIDGFHPCVDSPSSSVAVPSNETSNHIYIEQKDFTDYDEAKALAALTALLGALSIGLAVALAVTCRSANGRKTPPIEVALPSRK